MMTNSPIFQLIPDPRKIDVLDHGSVELLEFMGSDLSVVDAARVSFNKRSMLICGEDHTPRPGKEEPFESYLGDADVKLIKYLAKHKHWTPFAHPQISMRFKTPIPIRTQLDKTRVGMALHEDGDLVMNEISRRYVAYAPEVYTPFWRKKPEGSMKQGSSDVFDAHLSGTLDEEYLCAVKPCIATYERFIAMGVAPEQARFVLPQGVYTEFIWTGSLSAWARVYNLRSDPHAQWESREYADAVGKIVQPLFPVSWEVLTQTS